MDTTRKSARKLLKIRTYLAADLPFFTTALWEVVKKRIFTVRLTVGVAPILPYCLLLLCHKMVG